MELRNGRTILTIDERTGSIARLTDSRTGRVHLDACEGGRSDGRLFRVLLPVPEWSSRYADSHEQAAPTITREGGKVLLRWDNLKTRDEPAGVSAETAIEMPEGSDEVRFTLKIANGGPGPVADILFPWLGGWTGIGGKNKDMMILGAKTSFHPHSFPFHTGTTYARLHQRADFGYPLTLYAPWVDLSGPGGGISYIVYPASPQNGAVSVQNLAGYGPGLRLAYGWDFPTVIRPGEQWTSPPVGISLHGGDWKETADRWRAWMETWFVPPAGKRELRESIGFQNVWLRGFDGTPFRGLDSVPAVAAAGRKYGVNQLCIWDFITLGNYSKHADRDLLDYSPEERSVLSRGLAQARTEGTNVNALINFRLGNPNQTLFKKEAHAELIRCFDGSPRMEPYPTNHFHPLVRPCGFGPSTYILSACAKSFRARVLRQTR
ncbi:hypothetical protein JW777_10915, partial [bacterium]|nr:hypothetical protein [bacterium]